MPKKSLIIIIIVFIISVIGIVFLAWQVWPQQEVTESTQDRIDVSEWKTYRNEEMGFEMRYPNQWEMKQGSVKSGQVVLELSCCQNTAVPLAHIAIVVSLLPSFTDIEEYANYLREKDNEGFNEEFAPTFNIVNIHGVKSIRKTYPMQILGRREIDLYYPLIKKDKIISLNGGYITNYLGTENSDMHIEYVSEEAQSKLYNEIIEMHDSIVILPERIIFPFSDSESW